MNDLTGFHHVALTVSDRDASVAWYRDVLGFVELFREEGEDRRACVMRFAHGPIGIGVVEFTGPHDTFDERRTGLDHLALSVATRDDLDEWAAKLTASGIEHSGAIDVPPGAILNFRDPDGIALALFWDRPT